MNYVNRMILTQMKRLLSYGWMIRLLILSQHLFKVSTLHSHTITKTATPLVNCIVNDGLVDAVPNVHQTLLEFVNVVHRWLIHSLLDDAPHLVVNWIEIGTVWRPPIRWNKAGVASSRSRTVSRAWYAGALSCWKMKNSPDTSASLATAAVTGTRHGSRH